MARHGQLTREETRRVVRKTNALLRGADGDGGIKRPHDAHEIMISSADGFLFLATILGLCDQGRADLARRLGDGWEPDRDDWDFLMPYTRIGIVDVLHSAMHDHLNALSSGWHWAVTEDEHHG